MGGEIDHEPWNGEQKMRAVESEAVKGMARKRSESMKRK